MIVSLIVAVSENGVIGRDGGLPWHLSSDLKLFRQVTMGKPIIMGRKTFEAIGRVLPGRANIVVTRSRASMPRDVQRAGSIEEALAIAERTARADGQDELFVIGGGEIYRQVLPGADRVYRTQVHLSVDGDTSFPDLDPRQWREVSRTRYRAGDRDSADFSFVVLERRDADGTGGSVHP
jgi:dihydrofolate reductase